MQKNWKSQGNSSVQKSGNHVHCKGGICIREMITGEEEE